MSSQEAPVKHQETVNAGADWDEFWKLYPKKQAKPTAQKAWVAARKKSPAADIIAGLQRWLPTYASRDTRYVPQPSRWLNEERWNDEPDPPDDRKPTGRPPERPRVDPQREWEYR